MAALVMDNKAGWRGAVVAATGMPFSRFRALRRLEMGPLAQSELAARLGVDAPAMSVLVGELVDDGLVLRATDPADRRRNRLELTDAGRALVDGVRELPDAVPSVLGVLDEEEAATLHRILQRLHDGAGS
ncbi:MAG: hypothetical protein JWR55_431 [Aeromicrobium sp.]|nr:hypothetical protein [Aeromicrobium sp.]